ncbi:hypothetical protein ACQKOF_00055 [Lysinibacillus sp. NPDC093190]|uniref:hypothetical protein n=1 Tax=Lysinibacillus sp. NPDC093190 TaxID=3390575 RepID=UPI003D03E1F1
MVYNHNISILCFVWGFLTSPKKKVQRVEEKPIQAEDTNVPQLLKGMKKRQKKDVASLYSNCHRFFVI